MSIKVVFVFFILLSICNKVSK